MEISMNVKPVRNRVKNRYAGDHPRDYRFERHEANAQLIATRRRNDRKVVADAIAEAFEDHDANNGGGDFEAPGLTIIYAPNGRMLSATAG